MPFNPVICPVCKEEMILETASNSTLEKYYCPNCYYTTMTKNMPHPKQYDYEEVT